MIYASAVDLPSGLTEFLQQGGAFALLSIMVIVGVPWMIKNWKESINQTIAAFSTQFQAQQSACQQMVTQVTGSMEKIAEAMEAMKDEFGDRLRTVENHLEIHDRQGKRGV